MKIGSLKNTRNFHKWIGMVCAVFFIILSLSGFILMHYESLGLNEIEVNGEFLPDKYFKLSANSRSIQAITAAENGAFYVGTDYGLYRSRDEGRTWTHLEQGLFNQNIHALALDPVENDVLYAGTSGGIFKTEDGGDHWTDWFDSASGLTNEEVNDIVVHPRDRGKIFAATQGGLFISEDAGESWELLFDVGEVEDKASVKLVRLSSVDPDDVYIASESWMYRSRNGGNKWEPVWKNHISEVVSMVSLKTDPEFFYIGTRKGLFKSFNQGRNWVKDSNRDVNRVFSILADPNNASHLIISTGKDILFSRDGGDSWKPVKFNPDRRSESGSSSSPPEISRIYQTASPSSVLLAGSDSGLFLSRDKGKLWRKRELSNSAKQPEKRKMDFVKLITEIHTGRFFGNYFVLLIDLATLGLILLIFSGIWAAAVRGQIKRGKKDRPAAGELDNELLINVRETADDLSTESQGIHDMIEGADRRLEKEKWKSAYPYKEKKEIEKIDRRITTLDKKMRRLMERINEFEKFSRN